ncbi:MAG: hypothetical protein JWM59_1527, partial [Verrucomicrobiales bacterium]|nr:hypothetical protein [Verrucomicrobiales bacterium]
NFNIPADFKLTTQGPATPGSVPGTGNVTISGTLSTPFDDVPNVPEGGSTVFIMGMGLIGVETLRRRLVKAQA